MKSLNDIITELQAVDKTELDQASAAIDQAVADLQALAGAAPAAADPIVTITLAADGSSVEVATESGKTSSFVPQPASN